MNALAHTLAKLFFKKTKRQFQVKLSMDLNQIWAVLVIVVQ